MPTCLTTGVTGQGSAYLLRFLLQKGYRAIGMTRRSASSDMVSERLRWLGVLDQIDAGLNYEDHVVTRQDLIRPAEVDVLLGDAGKAQRKLGWQAHTTLEAMIAEMVEADLARHRARQKA